MINRVFEKDKLHNWFESLTVFMQPRVLGMLFLGFSAGLPYLLIFSTLNYWLRKSEISLTEIGYFSFIGMAFSVKYLWAPWADYFKIPILGLFGKRRSWILFGQLGVIIGLVGISFTDPSVDLAKIAAFSLVVALSSATQDIGIDAYRIEAMPKEYQGAMGAIYVWGYRIGIFVAGAGAIYLSTLISWTEIYQLMAGLMIVGVITVLIIREPENPELDKNIPPFSELKQVIKRMYISPIVEFFMRLGKVAPVIILLICIYKISDIVMGNMANPFYEDMGFSPIEIVKVSKAFGLGMVLFGGYLGGVLVMKIGLMRVLLLGAILVGCTNMLFAALAQIGHSVSFLYVTVGADNLAGGIATTAFIAYLSSLVNLNFTATQYALFSSIMTLPGKFSSGFSGVIIDATNYTTFFLYSSAMGIPAILVIIALMRYQPKIEQSPEPVVEVFE